MTGRLTTLGEAMREAQAAEDHAVPEEAPVPTVPTVQIRQDRVRRKLAMLQSIGLDGTFTLRAAIHLQPAPKAAN
jgi:hypothetical protein